MSHTRWGILAPGRIAHKFAADLAHVPGAELVAVGSRSAERSAGFAERYGAPGCRAHASYDALAADPDVDVVYVASPHALHAEHTRLLLEAGKPVLCEKPLTLNTAEAEALVALAEERGLFLMEAMWMACHPVVREIRRRLEAGDFGQPRQLHADLSFVVEAEPTHRLLDPALGAGALLDLGIYPLTFAHLMLGPVEQVAATGSVDERGVDHDVAMATRHAHGAVAALTASMTTPGHGAASIGTDQGLVDVPTPFHHPPYAVFAPADGGAPLRIEPAEPVLGQGYGNEAAEVMRCLDEGLLESPLVPHGQTLALLRVMDDVRRQLGVRYAADA